MGELPRTLRLEQFPSGAVYGYVLPNLERQMKAGMFPGVTKEMARKALSGTLVEMDKDGNAIKKEQTDEELEQWAEFSARLGAWMIRTEGGNVTYPDEDPYRFLGNNTKPRKAETYDVGKAVHYSWEDLLDPDVFPPDDLDALVLRALRSTPAPQAVATAPLERTLV